MQKEVNCSWHSGHFLIALSKNLIVNASLREAVITIIKTLFMS